MLMKNRKGMSIAIVILVFATLFISAFCLIAFNLRKNKLDNVGLVSLGDVYFIEEKLNFYINSIMEESFGKGVSREDFIMRFKENLEEYKYGGEYVLPQLSQVESQLDGAAIENGKVSLPLELRIEGFVEEGLYVSYKYTKLFEKGVS